MGYKLSEKVPDATAFSRLFNEQYDRVWQFALRRVDNQNDASDVTAEVFRRAWEYEVKNAATPSPSWLFGTARNIIGDLYRHRTKTHNLETKIREGINEEVPADSDLRVYEALDELSSEDQEILRLRYWDNLSGSEIACILGISESALWVRLHRSRKRFSDHYNMTFQRSSS